jgi:hypothetical protein
MLIGGAQGRQEMALQMARNIASAGQATALYVCFEHEEEYLIQRLIAMESALHHLPAKTGAVKIQDVKKEVMQSYAAAVEAGQRAKLGTNPRLRPSLERIAMGSNPYHAPPPGPPSTTHPGAQHRGLRRSACPSSTTSRRCPSSPSRPTRPRR